MNVSANFSSLFLYVRFLRRRGIFLLCTFINIQYKDIEIMKMHLMCVFLLETAAKVEEIN